MIDVDTVDDRLAAERATLAADLRRLADILVHSAAPFTRGD